MQNKLFKRFRLGFNSFLTQALKGFERLKNNVGAGVASLAFYHGGALKKIKRNLLIKSFVLWVFKPAGLKAFFYLGGFLSLLTAGANYNLPKSSSEKLYRADEAPHPLKGLQVQENLGGRIDLNLKFTDEKGESKPLKSYFKDRPVLMTIVYYNCPSLCNFHLNGLWKALNDLKWKNYEFVVLSMDSTEKAGLAFQKKQSYLQKFPKVSTKRVHFLTGSKPAIDSLAKALGFPFRWDEETEQFAHPPVAYSLSPEGMISRYLYGVEFLPQTLRLALLEAGRGKLGNVIDRVLLFCYRFNPKSNKYTLYASNIMKAGGFMMMLLIVSLIAPAWIRERRRK